MFVVDKMENNSWQGHPPNENGPHNEYGGRSICPGAREGGESRPGKLCDMFKPLSLICPR